MSDKKDAKTKTIKTCPSCTATKFRQHPKGPIIGGKMKVEGHDFQCLGCHKVYDGLDRLVDVKG